MEWILERDDLSGPVNLCSPNPVTNSEFTRTMGGILRRPTLFPVPRFALRITQGEIADMLLASVRATPAEAKSRAASSSGIRTWRTR